jgi:hypothetical protein
MSLDQDILTYAQGKVGQQVGTGDCWDLAEEAVTKSGGTSSKVFTEAKGKAFEKADYKWGTPVELHDVIPGDILQFRNHYFEKKSTTGNSWKTETQTRGHHTAIVERNLGSGRLIVLEQHVRPPEAKTVSKKVQRREIFVEDGVTYTDRDGRTPTTVTIKVKGTVRAYRPVIGPGH